MTSNFAAQLQDIANRGEAAMLACFKNSIQELVENNMQVPTARGGRMRVDTGFLRNSGVANIGSMPTGEAIRSAGAKPGQYVWSSEQLVTVLAKLKMGDVFYFGWTAAYAEVREIYDAYMETSLMRWQQIVSTNADKIRKKK